VQVECIRRTLTLTVDWQVLAAAAGGALAQGAAPPSQQGTASGSPGLA
jgi:hypothetical protein